MPNGVTVVDPPAEAYPAMAPAEPLLAETVPDPDPPPPPRVEAFTPLAAFRKTTALPELQPYSPKCRTGWPIRHWHSKRRWL
jgi:hypothetical protein